MGNICLKLKALSEIIRIKREGAELESEKGWLR